ncbi:MAG: hypothetical protein MSH60_05025 [Ruminococcus sp.]|nr:hypothetical protein [Ruminococcus sp.]
MFDFDTEYKKIMLLDEGAPRMDALKTAISSADSENDFWSGLALRYLYIKESIFADDAFQAIIMFPEYLALFDAHPEFEEEFSADIMWAFKWVLENSRDFYQVSLDRAEKYFDEFKKRCDRYGAGNGAYYMKKAKFYELIDPEISKAAFAEFSKTRRDKFSDCYACELNFKVENELNNGSLDAALKAAEPIFSGKRTCAEVPHVTYGAFMDYYARHGEYDKAMNYAEKMYRLISDNPSFLVQVGQFMELLSVMDNSRGAIVLRQHMKQAAGCKNPYMRMRFWIGAYRVAASIAEEDEGRMRIILPKNGLPAELRDILPEQPENHIYDASVLADMFKKAAEAIADKFDERNKSHRFRSLIDFTFPEYTGEKEGFFSMYTAPAPSIMTAVGKGLTLESVKAALENAEGLDASGLLIQDERLYATVTCGNGRMELQFKLSPFIPQMIAMAEPVHAIPEDEMERLKEADSMLAVLAMYSGNGAACFKKQLETVLAAAPETPVIIDMSAIQTISAKWAGLAVKSEVDPSFEYYVKLLPFTDDESDSVEITAMGLERFGISNIRLTGSDKQRYGFDARALQKYASELFYGENPENPVAFAYDNDENEFCGICVPGEKTDDEEERPLPLLRYIDPETEEPKAPHEYDIDFLKNYGFGQLRDEFKNTALLARERFGYFLDNIERAEQAAARVLVIDPEDEENYEYIWCIFEKSPDGKITAKADEEGSFISEGDEVQPYDGEDFAPADWVLKMGENGIRPDDVYLLD